MTPATIHLLARLIRHGRAILNDVEAWAKAQPPGPTGREVCKLVFFARENVRIFEAALSGVDFDPPGSEVDRPVGDPPPAALAMRSGTTGE